MDPMLQAYTLVIVDEAHERRVDTDLLFGAMKLCLNRRSDLKVSHILKEMFTFSPSSVARKNVSVDL